MNTFKNVIGLAVIAMVALMLPWPAFMLLFVLCMVGIVSTLLVELMDMSDRQFARNRQYRQSIAIRDMITGWDADDVNRGIFRKPLT